MGGLNSLEKKRPRRLTRLQWFLLLSVLFHALWLWRGALDTEPLSFEDKRPIEITELPPEAAPKQKVVPPKTKPKKRPEVAETEDAPNKELDPNAQFLSDRNQKADQQTKASQVDDFRKKQGTGLKHSLSRNRMPPATGSPEETGREQGPGMDTQEDKSKQAGVKRNWKSLTLKDLGLNGDGGLLGATDDHLEGVMRGDRTVLSTREFKYFSYYHRIKETLRQYWKPNVERKLAVLWNRGAKMRDAELVTQVLVLLDEKGSLTRVTRVTSSGFDDLDDAALEAFQQAAPFPNPPAGMKDPDGLVRIRWDFILKTEASPQISFRGAGGGRVR